MYTPLPFTLAPVNSTLAKLEPRTSIALVILTPVVPVGMLNTVASTSFLMLTSLVDPCPVSINPSADVYPIAALSPAAVSPSGSKVDAVATLVISIDVPFSSPPEP